jgi:hypothetical protein
MQKGCFNPNLTGQRPKGLIDFRLPSTLSNKAIKNWKKYVILHKPIYFHCILTLVLCEVFFNNY